MWLALTNIFILFQYFIGLSIGSIYNGQLQLDKCCDKNEVLDITTKKCTKSNVSELDETYPINPALAYFESENEENPNPGNIFPNTKMIICTDGAEQRIALNEESDEIIDADDFSFLIDAGHNGLLFVDDGVHTTFHHSYCIDRGFKDKKFSGTLAMFCHVPSKVACKTSTCINACCGPNMLYDIASHECIDEINLNSRSAISFDVSSRLLYEPSDLKIYDKTSNKILKKDLLTLFEAPKCLEEGYVAYNFTDDTLTIYGTGEIEVKKKLFDTSQYCLVHIRDDLDGHHLYQAKVCIEPHSKATNDANTTNPLKMFIICLSLCFAFNYIS